MNNDEANALIDEYQAQKRTALAAGFPLHPNLTEARKSAAVGLARHFIDKGMGEFAEISIEDQKVRLTCLGLTIGITTEQYDPAKRTLEEMFHHAEHLVFGWLDEAVSPHVNRCVHYVNEYGADFRARHGEL